MYCRVSIHYVSQIDVFFGYDGRSQFSGVGMVPGIHMADVIDSLIAVKKIPRGQPLWSREQNGEHRIKQSIEIKGEISEAVFEVQAYPTYRNPQKFKLNLLARKSVWRVDFDFEYKGHPNPLEKSVPPEIRGIVLDGTHYHSWADNRYLCTAANLPDRLLVARPMPDGIRSFDNALRWFCGKINIVLPANHMIFYPNKDILL